MSEAAHRDGERFPTHRPILLFDGVCNLCNGTVRFVVARDAKRQFLFAPLQSEVGKALLRRHGLTSDALDTFVLIEHSRVYTRSTAALRVARSLRTPWWALYALIWIPRAIRDRVYGLVARRRYDWFGRRETCSLPAPHLRDRFLS